MPAFAQFSPVTLCIFCVVLCVQVVQVYTYHLTPLMLQASRSMPQLAAAAEAASGGPDAAAASANADRSVDVVGYQLRLVMELCDRVITPARQCCCGVPWLVAFTYQLVCGLVTP
jgi:hypothetical protein